MDYYKDKPYVCDKIERLQYDLKMLGRMDLLRPSITSGM